MIFLMKCSIYVFIRFDVQEEAIFDMKFLELNITDSRVVKPKKHHLKLDSLRCTIASVSGARIARYFRIFAWHGFYYECGHLYGFFTAMLIKFQFCGHTSAYNSVINWFKNWGQHIIELYHLKLTHIKMKIKVYFTWSFDTECFIVRCFR